MTPNLELAMLDSGPRTATALALMDSEVLALDREDLILLFQQEPEAAEIKQTPEQNARELVIVGQRQVTEWKELTAIARLVVHVSAQDFQGVKGRFNPYLIETPEKIATTIPVNNS